MTDQNIQQAINFSRLLRSAEGLTQWRPLVVAFITLVAMAVFGALGSFLARELDGTARNIVALLAAGCVFIALTTGFSAVGVMLMDKAKRIASRSMTDAFIFGLMCLPKFLGFALVLLLLALVVLLIAALIYFVCKIPGVGPLLLFIAHPVLVVVSGFIFVAILWIGLPLFAPAIWEGRSFKEAISILYAAAKTRLVTVVALLIVLYLVVAIVTGLVGGVLIPGYTSMTTLAASILGTEASTVSWQSVMQMMMPGGGYHGYGYGSGDIGSGDIKGYIYAGLMATVLIFSVAGSLLIQVLIMGVNLVYLATVDGLDISTSQAEIENRLAQAKQKALEAQERAKQAAERARQPTRQPTQTVAPSVAVMPSPQATAMHCPNCKAAITAEDVFCGECGHKLKQ